MSIETKDEVLADKAKGLFLNTRTIPNKKAIVYFAHSLLRMLVAHSKALGWLQYVRKREGGRQKEVSIDVGVQS